MTLIYVFVVQVYVSDILICKFVVQVYASDIDKYVC